MKSITCKANMDIITCSKHDKNDDAVVMQINSSELRGFKSCLLCSVYKVVISIGTTNTVWSKPFIIFLPSIS